MNIQIKSFANAMRKGWGLQLGAQQPRQQQKSARAAADNVSSKIPGADGLVVIWTSTRSALRRFPDGRSTRDDSGSDAPLPSLSPLLLPPSGHAHQGVHVALQRDVVEEVPDEGLERRGRHWCGRGRRRGAWGRRAGDMDRMSGRRADAGRWVPHRCARGLWRVDT